MGFDGPEAATTGHQELKRICEMACCWDFIKDFPLQLETRIGCGGIKLSGGQTQCLTIARALIKKPAFLILDEATAALDNETQKKVSQNISKLQKEHGFTIVQIAHRLTTLTDSDIIYFLDHGTVAEAGGLETQNGSAVEELNKIEIEHRSVVNPETKKEEERINRGFFHHHWNAANDIKAFHELSVGKLTDKVRELRDDLHMARAELGRQNATKLLPPLVLDRTISDPASFCRSEVSEYGATAPAGLEASEPSTDNSSPDLFKAEPIASGIFASMLVPLTVHRAITCPAA